MKRILTPMLLILFATTLASASAAKQTNKS